MRKILIATALSALLFLSSGKIAKAESCNPIYGGGPGCITSGGLILDATVMNPQTNQMVNNLSANDPKYSPGSTVTFQIKLINSTNSAIGEIDVQNGFPPYLNYLTGEGNFDTTTKILSFRVHNLEPNKPKTYTITGKIAESSQLPGGNTNSITCVANQAVAIVFDPASAKDTSSFCIEKIVQFVPTPTPIIISHITAPVIPSEAFADTSCQPIYGGGQTCVTSGNILINKTVMNPATSKIVENLGINDSKYHPGFITTFQISITNSGNSTIAKIDVKDIFPQYVTFSSGPGTFDEKSKTLSFSIQDIKAQETKTITIMGRIVNANQISISQGSVVCVVNQAIATNLNDNTTSQDNSQFCIEKKAVSTPVPATKGGFPVLSPVPVYATPPTGQKALVLFSLIPTGILGWFLRKIKI